MATPKAQQRRANPATPLSPSIASRKDEKEQMINLNNRLAVYVEKVRSLENENSRLLIKVNSFEQANSLEVNKMKAMYDSELSEARRLLDELSKDKAQMQIEVSSYREKYESEKSRANQLEHNKDLLEKKLKDMSALQSAKEAQYSRVKKERDDFCNEIDGLKATVSELQEELDGCQKSLEAETLLRVDFENKLQSVKEELLFKERLYQEEISEVRRRHSLSLTEVSVKAKGDYESKLEAAIMDLRDQQQADLELLKEELELQYTEKIKDLTKQLDRTRKSQLNNQESSKAFELKVERLQVLITSLQTEIKEKKNLENLLVEFECKKNNQSNLIQDLQGQIEAERQLRISTVMSIEKERDDIRATLLQMEKDYNELLDIKLQLDQEIAVYRKLLEEEEERLNLSPKTTEGSAEKGRTRSRRKRKRGLTQTTEGEARAKKPDITISVQQTTTERSQRRLGQVRHEDILHQQAEPSPEGNNSCLVM